MKLSIGPAKDADIIEVLGIEKATFPNPWVKEQFEDCLKDGNKKLFVARMEEGIVGYIVFEFMIDEGYVSDLAVKEGYREKGIGKKLFEKVLGEAKKMGLKWIELEVRASNRAAIAFYSVLGFKETRRRKAYYSSPVEDAIVMYLELKK